MSDPRSTEPYRRLNLHGGAARMDGRTSAFRTGAARAGTAAPSWTTIWTWLAAIAAAVVVLGLVFGYGFSGRVSDQSGEPATTGSAPHGPGADAPASDGVRTPPPGDAG